MPDLNLRGVIRSKSGKKVNKKSFAVKDDTNYISKWTELFPNELMIVHLDRKYNNIPVINFLGYMWLQVRISILPVKSV